MKALIEGWELGEKKQKKKVKEKKKKRERKCLYKSIETN